MELRQLRSLVTLVESGCNVSRAAERLFMVQSAVSQHILRLEEELGVHLFMRQGKRILGLTEAGEQVLQHARRVLAETGNILDVGREHVDDSSGVLRIGTTHTQARYVLPPVVKRFNRAWPRVELQIHQDTPRHLVRMLLDDKVDFAICTEDLAEQPHVTTVAGYQWNRSVIVPPGHPLLLEDTITLASLCAHPLITYVRGFTGRGHFDRVLQKAGVEPHIVLTAADTDVIKTYVRERMGIGIIASMAYCPRQDRDLAVRALDHLFPWEVTYIAYRENKYLRRYQEHFIDLFRAHASESGQGAVNGLRPV